MKKLLASSIILTLLSYVGTMCMASSFDEELDMGSMASSFDKELGMGSMASSFDEELGMGSMVSNFDEVLGYSNSVTLTVNGPIDSVNISYFGRTLPEQISNNYSSISDIHRDFSHNGNVVMKFGEDGFVDSVNINSVDLIGWYGIAYSYKHNGCCGTSHNVMELHRGSDLGREPYIVAPEPSCGCCTIV